MKNRYANVKILLNTNNIYTRFNSKLKKKLD